jgi:hypothetical protein
MECRFPRKRRSLLECCFAREAEVSPGVGPSAAIRPERRSRWRGPRCLLARRSRSARHVRELSFSDPSLPADPVPDTVSRRGCDPGGSIGTASVQLPLKPDVLQASQILAEDFAYRDRAEVLLEVEAASDDFGFGVAPSVPAESSMEPNSPASPRSKVSRAWAGSPRCPAVVAPSRSIT